MCGSLVSDLFGAINFATSNKFHLKAEGSLEQLLLQLLLLYVAAAASCPCNYWLLPLTTVIKTNFALGPWVDVGFAGSISQAGKGENLWLTQLQLHLSSGFRPSGLWSGLWVLG